MLGLGGSSSCRRRTPLSRWPGWSYRRCSAPTTTSKPRFGTGKRTRSLAESQAKELGFWPATAKEWTWTWQRFGRYKYQKVLVHSTNPEHLVPSAARGSGGLLRVAARYAAGGERCSTTREGFSARCATRSRRTTRALPVTRLWTGLAHG